MQKKLTITVDEKVYEGLYRVVGPGRISKFIERLVRPHVLPHEFDLAYREMAQDRDRESAALGWADSLIEDLEDDEQRRQRETDEKR